MSIRVVDYEVIIILNIGASWILSLLCEKFISKVIVVSLERLLSTRVVYMCLQQAQLSILLSIRASCDYILEPPIIIIAPSQALVSDFE